MAFNVQSWGRMSSSCNNKITTLQDGSFVGAPNFFTYASSTDLVATIAAANYFNPVVAELNVGDTIYVVGSDTQTMLSVVSFVLYPPAVVTQQSVSIGDVDGPAGATDNALARFDGNTGKIIQNGIVLESDLGDLTLVRTIENAAGTGALPSYTFTGDADTGMWHSAANTLDFSTNAFRGFQIAASPALSVNFLSVAASATTNPLPITATGTDANIGIQVIPKGTGALINAVGAVATPSYSFVGRLDTGMWSSAAATIDFSTTGGRQLQISNIAAAVDFISIRGSATNAANAALQPSLVASGTDAVVDVAAVGKGATGGLAVLPSSTGASGSIKFWNGAGTFYTMLQGAAVVANRSFTLPLVDGAAGQVLGTNGAGVLSFVNNAIGTWVDQAATPVTMTANTEYVNNVVALATYNMPALAAFGDTFEIAGNGAGGWVLQAAGGQTINLGSSPTTVAGSLASTNRYDCVKLVCTVANTTFTVISSIGNLTVA